MLKSAVENSEVVYRHGRIAVRSPVLRQQVQLHPPLLTGQRKREVERGDTRVYWGRMRARAVFHLRALATVSSGMMRWQERKKLAPSRVRFEPPHSFSVTALNSPSLLSCSTSRRPRGSNLEAR